MELAPQQSSTATAPAVDENAARSRGGRAARSRITPSSSFVGSELLHAEEAPIFRPDERRRTELARATAPAVDEKNAALVAQAAEKVAKEEPLELEEDDEKWRENDGTAFDSALQVDPEHGVSPVKLIDMRFIIALGELGGTMVRRQDLPKEAFIDLDTLKRLDGGYGSLPIISISHPWQQPDHPDPKEVNLQLLAKVMKLMLEYYKQAGIGTFAVFFE